MANKLVISPFHLDTPQNAPLILADINIKRVDLAGYDDSTYGAELRDKDGNIIVFLRGNAQKTTVSSGTIGVAHGLTLPVNDSFGNPNLRSGNLLVYF